MIVQLANDAAFEKHHGLLSEVHGKVLDIIPAIRDASNADEVHELAKLLKQERPPVANPFRHAYAPDKMAAELYVMWVQSIIKESDAEKMLSGLAKEASGRKQVDFLRYALCVAWENAESDSKRGILMGVMGKTLPSVDE